MSGTYNHNKNFVQHENLRALAYVQFTFQGFLKCIRDWKHLLALVFADAILAMMISRISVTGLTAEMEEDIYKCVSSVLLIVSNIVVLAYWGMPSGFWRIMRRVERVPQFRNEDREPPLLIQRCLVDDSAGVEEWTFRSYGIAYSEWSDPRLQEQFENSLDVAVLGAKYGVDNTLTVLKLINHPGPWPEIVPWNEKYLPSKTSQICVGLNRSYPVVIDLSVHPHYMIGGETGSGKTILILSVIYQCLLRGYHVYLVDMKHYVDYSKVLRRIDRAVDDETSLSSLLLEIVEEMHRRLAVLRESGCSNVEQYNEAHTNNPMSRIILVIDEYMEAVVKTGDKDQKQRGEQIEALIATLCKLSRAAGISVIIGLQRGGQEISGQIRSNVRVILGSCNDNLSIVMTGSAELGRMLPTDSVGMFITDDRQLFKSFYGGFDN